MPPIARVRTYCETPVSRGSRETLFEHFNSESLNEKNTKKKLDMTVEVYSNNEMLAKINDTFTT
jgi:hypothetical protein